MAPPRKRAALRLLSFLVTHSEPVSALLYLLGVAGILALPFLARNTYIDENAMLAGSAATRFGYAQAADAVSALDEAAAVAAAATRGQADSALRAWLLDELRSSGLRAEEHAFEVAPRRRGRPGTRRRGVSVVAAARAQRGDGKETLVLVTPLDGNATLGVGVGLALVRHLADAPWLSRDVLWLAADAGCAGGAHAAAEAWLADYQERYGSAWRGAPPPPPPQPGRFLRGGMLTAAVVLDAPGDGFDALQLRMQGTHGALPNLDVVGLLHALAGAPQQLHGQPWDGDAPGHAHSLRAYAATAAAAARFMGRQARGEPDGAHGAFLDAAVDAVTVVAVAAPLRAAPALQREAAAQRLGAMLEGSVRSLSNLLERLHHSSAFYVMLSPSRFIDAGKYMPPGGLLLAAPLLSAVACSVRGAGAHWPAAPSAADWLQAGLVAAAINGAGAASGALLVHATLPLRDAGAAPAPQLLACWAAVMAAFFVCGLHASRVLLRDSRPLRAGPWVALKALLLAASSLLFAQGVILQSGLALPLAALLVPACLAARPAPPGGAVGYAARAARAARWLLLAAASPPVVLSLAALALDCTPDAVVWRVAEHAAEWDTLSTTLAFGAYLPCFVACAALLAA